jgi:hypothetical protein
MNRADIALPGPLQSGGWGSCIATVLIKSQAFQVGLRVLTDAVRQVYHQLCTASRNAGWTFETHAPVSHSSSSTLPST